MAEPEELLIEGAHVATRFARDAWRRYGPHTAASVLPLSAVRARLELFVTALFSETIPVVALEPPAPQTWLRRLAYGRAPALRVDPFASGTDGRRVCLPAELPLQQTDGATVACYLLLAVQQAARVVRGTPRTALAIGSDDTRNWFVLAEAVAVDRWVASQVPGLRDALRAVRADALARRPGATSASPIEQLVRFVLGSDPAGPVPGLPDLPTPAASLTWARTRPPAGGAPRRHPPLTPVGYWGQAFDPAVLRASGSLPDAAAVPQPAERRVSEMRRRPRARQAPDDEDDDGTGTWVIRADEPMESVEDPFGLQRPIDRGDDADPDGLGDSLSDLPEARMVRTPEQAREVLRSGEELTSEGGAAPAPPPRCGIVYPEWDHRIAQYRERGAVVRERAAPLGDSRWAASALARHAALVRRVRARFERLRPRPMRLDRQPDGPEVDIGAYVTAAADLRAGTPIDNRMYTATRPARRELAVALLVDVSASTDSWVTSDRRIVDVEKEALLVVGEALDALGDRYGIFAFSGEGPEDVAVLSLKTFDEAIGLDVRRRIAALDADRYTRIGAPIRHLTAALGRERAPRRLLLILSDGKPNDVDLYEGQYGVEDARQAIAEARRQGVAVFSLTVDREAPRYAARLFGRGGFAVLHRAEQLPAVLIDVLRELIRL